MVGAASTVTFEQAAPAGILTQQWARSISPYTPSLATIRCPQCQNLRLIGGGLDDYKVGADGVVTPVFKCGYPLEDDGHCVFSAKLILKGWNGKA